MTTFEDIEVQLAIVNEKQSIAKSDKDWQEYNSQLNKLGEMIESFGKKEYKRVIRINLILESSEKQ